MARINTKTKVEVHTHEGAPAWPHATAEQQLRRCVLSCLLWEDEFYIDGESIAKQIEQSARAVPPKVLADLAIEARAHFNLRHVPLLLLAILAQTGKGTSLVSDTIGKTIQRADELTEFLAVYAKVNGVKPGAVKKKLSAQVKKGLAQAFTKFDAYQLGKYDRAGDIRLRDSLFLCHAKPLHEEQAALWKKLVDGTLESPDTWEVSLSAGADKKETFERLLRDGKLGYLALLRNLRNMEQAGVDRELVENALLARRGAHRVLPFRFVAAARACPSMEPALDKAFLMALEDLAPLPGKTAVLSDCSGSMTVPLSAKSQVTRMDAAAVLAACVGGNVRLFAFGTTVKEVAPRRGMAGVDVLQRANVGWGTNIGEAVKFAHKKGDFDRIIVITDEQSHDQVTLPDGIRGYMINVASYRNGIGYGKWIHLDGFSENVIRFIQEYEAQ